MKFDVLNLSNAVSRDRLEERQLTIFRLVPAVLVVDFTRGAASTCDTLRRMAITALERRAHSLNYKINTSAKRTDDNLQTREITPKKYKSIVVESYELSF